MHQNTRPRSQQLQTRRTGMTTTVHRGGRFGFIAPSDGAKPIFVHRNEIRNLFQVGSNFDCSVVIDPRKNNDKAVQAAILTDPTDEEMTTKMQTMLLGRRSVLCPKSIVVSAGDSKNRWRAVTLYLSTLRSASPRSRKHSSLVPVWNMKSASTHAEAKCEPGMYLCVPTPGHLVSPPIMKALTSERTIHGSGNGCDNVTTAD